MELVWVKVVRAKFKFGFPGRGNSLREPLERLNTSAQWTRRDALFSWARNPGMQQLDLPSKRESI